MSSIGSTGGAAGAQTLALIQQLNDVAVQAQQSQTDFALKVTKLALTQTIDAQKQSSVTALLDKVV